MFKFKLVDHHAARKSGAEYLQKAIIPLLAQQWEAQGQSVYGTAMSFNLEQFSALWLTGGLTMVIAYEDEQPVGIFIGVRFRPMMFNRQVLTVENCWGIRADVEDALYKYVVDLFPVLGIDEMWVQGDVNRVPALTGDVVKVRETVTVHFARV